MSLFNTLVHKILSGSHDYDHPDENALSHVISEAESLGLQPLDGGQALLTAREIKSLQELEKLNGGGGEESAQIDPTEIRRTLFHRER